jgi:hypothetical protein
VSVNLHPSLPQRKLYQNLRGLEVVNAPERPLLNGAGEFAVSHTNNVPEFSFAAVSESETCDAVMSIRSDAVGVDGIPLSFIKLLLPVVIPVLTHIFNHIFVSSEFLGK